LIALKKVWTNNYFKTVFAIVLIITIVLGVFFGLQLGLKTSDPMLTVISGSMSIPYDASDYNIWLTLTHPFDRTLSVGDIIIIQGINIKDLNTNYPNSDIIVFRSPINGELIVHRIIGTEVVNGTTYFQTKGDGNGNPWPQTPRTGFDPWDNNNPPGVPQNLVVGKVIMRIPWFGWITIEMRTWALPVVISLLLLLVVIEFVIPIFKNNKKTEPHNETQRQVLIRQIILLQK
jgi:signal peptidase I